MRIQRSDIPLDLMGEKREFAVKSEKNDLKHINNEGNPVQVSISNMGYELSRESIAKVTEGKSWSNTIYDNIFKDITGKAIIDLEGNLRSELLNTLNNQKKGQGVRSPETKGDYYLSAYADIYDRISREYEEGTRDIWVFDSSTEVQGYRKVTKEEELAALDKVFAEMTEINEGYSKQVQIATKAVKELAEYLREIRGQPKLDILGDDPIVIENFHKKMMTARDEFKNKYFNFSILEKEEKKKEISNIIKDAFTK